MAAGNVTLGPLPYTIQATVTEYVGTKGSGGLQTGNLVNAGSGTCYVSVNGTAVAKDDVQVEGEVPLPPGASMPILTHFREIRYACKTGVTTTLAWFPDK